jgi:hypothetical protein
VKTQVRDAAAAIAVAGVVSGAPSTAHSLLTGRSVLAPTRAAGTLLGGPTVVRGLAAHAALSLSWGVVLARVLPRGHRARAGLAAGAAIAALDLGLVARRFPAIRALPQAPQWADHLVFGAVLGAFLDRRDQRSHKSGRERAPERANRLHRIRPG